MARPLRIEFPGALYHVTSRGDRKKQIYEDIRDRHIFLNILGEAAARSNWSVLAYCLMGNHYHLLVETPEGNLSSGMRYLNGVFSQASNRRHGRVGHVFQGRYKSILVDAQSYLLEVARYIVLNPVRAGFVELPEQWRWSSYLETLGTARCPKWLAKARVLENFDHDVNAYRKFVLGGIGKELWASLNQQIYLGDDSFVAATQLHAPSGVIDIPATQQRPPAPSLSSIERTTKSRHHAIRAAYSTGAYTYRDLADYFGMHPSSIGYVVTKQA